jgi:hypothetical protein
LVAKCTSPAKESVTGADAVLDGVGLGAAGLEVVACGAVADPPVGEELLPVHAGTANSTHRAVAANQVTGGTDRTPGV